MTVRRTSSAARSTAGTGIGGATPGQDIDIAATSLDATLTGSSGGIFISGTGDLALGRVDAGTRDITLTAGSQSPTKTPRPKVRVMRTSSAALLA